MPLFSTVPMDMVVLAMLAMPVSAMLAMLDTPMPMVPITLVRGLLMLSLRLMLMPLFSMVPMAMLVLAMLAMLAMVDTPMLMEVTPMPMVPTATLDKKFFSISPTPFRNYLLSKSLSAAATTE